MKRYPSARLTAALILQGAAGVAFAQDAAEAVPTATEPLALAEPVSETSAGTEAAAETLGSIPVETGATAEAPPPAPRSASRVMEEIVVTAQRREENLQDVPVSVSAFSAEKLDALGVENAQDLQLVTPGLVYSNSAINYALIYIRGIGTDVFIPSADSSVATYLDGVYFPFAHGLAGSFTELERIEVLKGPQGTLFGRNTTGGAINIITKKPSDQFEAKLSGTLGNFNKRSSRGYVSAPLADGLAVSLAALYQEQDSYYRAAVESPVQAQPESEDKGAHVKLHYDITDQLSLDLAGLTTRSEGALLNSIEDTKLLGAAFRPAPTRPYEYNSNVDGYLKSKNQLAYGSLGWAGDAINAKLFGSYEKVNGSTLYDFDGGPGNGVYFDVPDEFVKATTAEFQLQSTPGGLLTFSDTVNYTVGYYYFDSIGGYGSVNFGLVSPNQPGTAPLFGLEQLLGVLDAFQELGLPIPDNVEIQERGTVDTQSHAGYGQATWRPIDWFGLTLGGRFQKETRRTVISGSSLSLSPSPATIPAFTFAPQQKSTTNFSPKVTVDFKPFSDETLLYASWQKGFKSGTFNVVSLNIPPAYVKPEEVTAIEVGIKGQVLDGALVYNVAAFNNQIKNLQTLNISLTSGGSSQLSNAAEASIKGFDFDITWQAFPDALPGFVITASGAYLDGKYDSFPEGSGFDPVTGLYFGKGALAPHGPVSFTGNTTTRTPERSGTLGLSQTVDFDSGTLELGFNASHNSGYFFDTQNTSTQPRYTLINARASYLYQPWQLRAAVFAENITDKLYYSDKLITDFGTNAYLAPPRTYGMTLSWEYGR